MRYDAILSPHHHLYSSKTDRIEDFVDKDLDRLIDEYFKKKEVWQGWPDFFGKPTEYHENNYLNYEEASMVCQQKRLKNSENEPRQ